MKPLIIRVPDKENPEKSHVSISAASLKFKQQLKAAGLFTGELFDGKSAHNKSNHNNHNRSNNKSNKGVKQ